MDWTTTLRAQQDDFIQRLRSGQFLHSEIEGQHSELTVISGEKLEKLRYFCWEMAEKYKRMSSVRDVFINNLKGKLGEEVFKVRLAEYVTEVDYEKRLGGDGKVDFTLTSDPSVGIQVKARHGSIDTVRWSISLEELEKNSILFCVWIKEDVSEAQAEYHIITAGFLPTNIIQQKLIIGNHSTSVTIKDLLYCGGLRSHLNTISDYKKCLNTLSGHSGAVNSVAISPNGKIIASGSSDKTIKIWNLTTGRNIRTLTGHSWSVFSVAISHDGKTLASGSGDETIKVWNLETGELLHTILCSFTIFSVTFVPNKKLLLSGGCGKEFAFWDLEEGRFSSGPIIGVTSVSISGDGQIIANGRGDGIIQIDCPSSLGKSRTFVGHSGWISSVALSLNGQILASAGSDKTIKIWNLNTGEMLQLLTGHTDSVESVAISPDCQTLVSSSSDSTIKIWNLYTGQLLKTLSGHSGEVKSVFISPDGQIIASGSIDRTIKIWRLG